MHATAPSARARYAPIEMRADEAPVALHFGKGSWTGCSTTQFKRQKKNAPIISPYPNNILCTFQMETTA